MRTKKNEKKNEKEEKEDSEVLHVNHYVSFERYSDILCELPVY